MFVVGVGNYFILGSCGYGWRSVFSRLISSQAICCGANIQISTWFQISSINEITGDSSATYWYGRPSKVQGHQTLLENLHFFHEVSTFYVHFQEISATITAMWQNYGIDGLTKDDLSIKHCGLP